MKAVKIVFGSLAGLYCVLQIIQLIHVLMTETGVMQQSSLAAGAALILISGLIAFACFRSAVAKAK